MFKIVTSVLLIALALAFSRTQTQDTRPAPVKAILYPMWVVPDSGLERSHGGGWWINELYLPDRGVVCNVTWRLDAHANPPSFDLVAVSNAFYGSFEDRKKGTLEVKKDYVWAQKDVEVPRDVADRIIALADLTKRQREATRDVAKALTATFGLDEKGGRHPLPKSE
jgi:hypothetical protein